MQTFLPYPDFQQSVAILDQKRLGKQRVETLQILKALKVGGGLSRGWTRHPASRMWKGYELALLKYQEATIDEWVGVRHYKDTCWEKSKAFFTEEELQQYEAGDYEMPDWFKDPNFHIRHKSKLVEKAPEIYAHIFPNVPENMPYYWPCETIEQVKEREAKERLDELTSPVATVA